jgi:butyryl-CoA dehydrogenase
MPTPHKNKTIATFLATFLGGWQMARAALIAEQKLQAGEGDAKFYRAKIGTARFFADHILSQASGYRTAIVAGSAGVMALSEDQF